MIVAVVIYVILHKVVGSKDRLREKRKNGLGKWGTIQFLDDKDQNKNKPRKKRKCPTKLQKSY